MEKKSNLNKILLGVAIGLAVVTVGVVSILYGFDKGTSKNRLNKEQNNKYVTTNNNSVQKNEKNDETDLNKNISNDKEIENKEEIIENNNQEIETEENNEIESEENFEIKNENEIDEEDSLVVKLSDAEITDKTDIISKSDLIDKFFKDDDEYEDVDELDDYEELREEPTEKPFPDLDNLINNEENNNENNGIEENNNNEENNNGENNNEEVNNEENNNVEENNEENNMEPVFVEIPEKFDLREKINLTVENQGQFGLCWSFASLKSLETNLALTTGQEYNFSEIHMDYMTSNELSSNSRKVHSGGGFSEFIKYNIEFKGVVLQDKLEYRNYSKEEALGFYNTEKADIVVTDYINFDRYTPDMKEEWGEEKFNEYQESIKEHIMKYGSIAFSIENSKLNASVVNYYCNNDSEVEKANGHYMSIIGWDDNYSKDNFVSPTGLVPEKDGAYIVLNSWGEESGENGYLYISYEDCNVHEDMYGIISTSENIDSLIDLDAICNFNLVNGIKDRYADYIIEKDGKNYISKVTLLNVNGSKVLDLSNINLTSLTGIELFSDAVEVYLSNNKLESVEELNSLKNLVIADLSNNNIADVSVLKNNEKLGFLNLANNMNVQGYEELTNLLELNISNCNVTDISFIENFAVIENLNLSGNKINLENDYLNNKKLYQLYLDNCDLTKVPNLEKSTYLMVLDLSNNKNLVDYSALENIEKIEKLILKNNNIKDITVLNNNNVTTVDLSGNKEISNINELIGVSYLIMKNCDITDVSIFDGLQLVELDLSENTGLTGVLTTEIESLKIENCNLDDEFDFFGRESFNTLSIYGNDISLDYVFNTISCNKIKYNDIKFTELDKIPENVKLYDTVIVINCKFSNENVNFRLVPEIRKYSDFGIVDSFENVKINKTYFRGRITSEYAIVEVKNINSNKYEICHLKFDMDVVLSDMFENE